MVAQTSAWFAARMLMQKPPLARILGQLDEVLPGQKATRGGASESDTND